MRQSIKRRTNNLKTLDKVKKAAKQVKKLASSKQIEEAKKALVEAYKALDKAAKKHVIHKNTASRKKSRLAKLLAKSSK